MEPRVGGKPPIIPPPPPPPVPTTTGPTRYYARFNLSGARSIKQLEEVLQSVADHLAKADGAEVTLTLPLELNASSKGFDDHTVRVVRENAGHLGAKANEFEA
jgi:hypothetical protein